MALIDGDDLGRKRVDKTLEELEKDLEGIYQTASEEMQMKLDRYLERYAAREERYLAMVESGDMSIDEFNHWRENQILYSNGMRVQIEALTNDAVNADRIASDMINNTMPYVYSTSYNYMGFIGSMQAQYAGMEIPAFPMVNMEAFRILATEDPTLIPINLDIEEDRRWNQQHITSAITQGIVQGEAIPQISRRLRQVTDMDSRAARRNARTACTYIENRGRREGVQKLRDAGIPFDEPWNATIDDRTRETHILLHGTLPNEDGYYGEGILDVRHKPLMREPADPDGALDEVYNCRCCVKAWLHGIDHSDFEDRYARFMTEEYYDDWERLGEERERHGYEDQERRFEQRRQEAQGRNEEIRREYYAQQDLDKKESQESPADNVASMTDDRSSQYATQLAMIDQMTGSEMRDHFIDDPNSYYYSEEYSRLSGENMEAFHQRQESGAEMRMLETELQEHQMPKPRDQWNDNDEFMALLGSRPMIYDERGQEIDARLSELRDIYRDADHRWSQTSERMGQIDRHEYIMQASDWRTPTFTRGSIENEYVGFSTHMGIAELDRMLEEGRGYIAEMSPREYLDCIAMDIFHSTRERAILCDYSNVREYAHMMADGVQFDMGYLDYANGGQEGRHRAMAAELLGIEKIPVYIRGR